MAYQELYDYTPNDAVQLAGTHSQFSLDNGTTWKPLKGCQELGEIGSVSASVEQTTIDDTSKRYRGAIKDADDKELTMFYYAGDADQEALRAAADSLAIIKVRHQFKTGAIATYELALLGWKMVSGNAEALMQFTISGKQNGEVVWTTAQVVTP